MVTTMNAAHTHQLMPPIRNKLKLSGTREYTEELAEVLRPWRVEGTLRRYAESVVRWSAEPLSSLFTFIKSPSQGLDVLDEVRLHAASCLTNLVIRHTQFTTSSPRSPPSPSVHLLLLHLLLVLDSSLSSSFALWSVVRRLEMLRTSVTFHTGSVVETVVF
ncbi:hypothetical protein E2C01_032793 [Portunus trituberculatus]|uniref:Uncharacterized protein n=1 Tax=Portunus trituberculatus TaxID=210409 RepID=A0A5B7F3V0_PORTR|nr:hypothetical protein [Portunus trituberculatus]